MRRELFFLLFLEVFVIALGVRIWSEVLSFFEMKWLLCGALFVGLFVYFLSLLYLRQPSVVRATFAVCCSMLQCVAMCVAVCCSMWQCLAVCCSARAFC